MRAAPLSRPLHHLQPSLEDLKLSRLILDLHWHSVFPTLSALGHMWPPASSALSTCLANFRSPAARYIRHALTRSDQADLIGRQLQGAASALQVALFIQ